MHTTIGAHSGLRTLLLSLLLSSLPGVPVSLGAQAGVTLAGGPASWDLSGTGTGTTLALRWDRAVTDPTGTAPLSLELGLGWFQDGQSGQGAVDLLLPEVGARVGLPGPLDLGAGVGWAIGLEDRNGDDLALWAALGADLPLGSGWSLRPELRARSIDPWVGAVTDYSLGVRRALG